MAGGHHLRPDVAIDRWSGMRETYYKHFRFTSRSAVVTAFGLGVIPATYYFLASAPHYEKWNWNGKLKGESLRA